MCLVQVEVYGQYGGVVAKCLQLSIALNTSNCFNKNSSECEKLTYPLAII